MGFYRLATSCLLVIIIAGCSSISGGRYSIRHDRAPDRTLDASKIKDAVPRVEPRSRYGNKSPYTVLGKRYYVMPNSFGYSAEGMASWYGKKFHGHKTSNGEIYNMYAMSAAHRTLPLPTYLSVRNLDNGKQIIVRVNDRGPFHGNRLLDLSYAAATKLGMLKRGTAHVRIEAINPASWQSQRKLDEAVNRSNAESIIQPAKKIVVTPLQPLVPANKKIADSRPAHSLVTMGRYLQVGAYSTQQGANSVKIRLQPLLPELTVKVKPVELATGKRLYRVHIGPLHRTTSLTALIQYVEQLGYKGSHLVELP